MNPDDLSEAFSRRAEKELQDVTTREKTISATVSDLREAVFTHVSPPLRALVCAQKEIISEWPWAGEDHWIAVRNLRIKSLSGIVLSEHPSVKIADGETALAAHRAWLMAEAKRRARAHVLSSARSAKLFAAELVRECQGEDYCGYVASIVGDFLETEAKSTAIASKDIAKQTLVRNVRAHLKELPEALGLWTGGALCEEEDQPLEGGILRWDERFALFCERFGPLGKERADSIRSNARERIERYQKQLTLPGGEPTAAIVWELWADMSFSPEGGRFVWSLARTLWVVEVRERIEREVRKPAGIISTVYQSITLYASRGLTTGEENGSPVILRPHPKKPKHGNPIIVADLPVISSTALDIARGLAVLGGKFALPCIEWLAETAHNQHLNGDQRADRILIEGGWQRVTAEVLGVDVSDVNPRDRQDVMTVFRMIANTPVHWQDGARSSSIVLIDEDASAAGSVGRGRGRAILIFKVADRIMFGETHRAPERMRMGGGVPSASDFDRWRIVPLPKPRLLAPLPKSPRDTYGPQAVFMRVVWQHIATHGDQLLRDGGVEITDIERVGLATEAQLPNRLALNMLDWLAEQRVIELTGEGRYAPADAKARAFIVEGWSRRQHQSERGQRSAALKRRPNKPRKS